jgi:hypothetical protein
LFNLSQSLGVDCGYQGFAQGCGMSKRTSLLAATAALIAGMLIGWFIANEGYVSTRPIDPVVSARKFATEHYPRLFSKDGTALSYSVEDHGDVWSVEVTPQGQMGGGLRLIVGRESGVIEPVGLTQ